MKKYFNIFIFLFLELSVVIFFFSSIFKLDATGVSILVSVFLLANPLLYYILTKNKKTDFSFWFVMYSVFKITPYIFPIQITWFDYLFKLKIYFNILFLLYLFWKLIIFIKEFSRAIKNKTPEYIDEYTFLSSYLQKNVKFKKLGQMISFEVCSFYYALLKWKNDNSLATSFTGYKNSGVLPIYIGLVFVSIVEATGFHVLLFSKHKTISIVLLVFHLYLLVNIIGQIKALILRKHIILDKNLYLCYGLFNTIKIPLSTIYQCSKFEGDYNKKEKKLLKMALLGKMEPHNVLLELQDTITAYLPFGIIKKPNKILLYIDNYTEFMEKIDKK